MSARSAMPAIPAVLAMSAVSAVLAVVAVRAALAALAVPATLAVAAVATVTALAPAALQAQTLASIPVQLPAQPGMAPSATTTATTTGTPAPALRARIHTADAPGLAHLLGLPGPPAGTQGAARFVDLALQPGRHADLVATADALAASFIVDFEDPAVVRLAQQLAAEHGAAPIDGAQVVAFVARLMRADLAANANLASEVARSLQGDCTEYALLTAALARSLRIPARIVHGAALLVADGQWQALGHAWVQTYEAGRWIVRDGALANAPGPVYYVPAYVMTDEGPGYRLGMFQGFGRMPSRIELLGAADAQPAR